jgi:4-hydroxyacetophenone monooxygenase
VRKCHDDGVTEAAAFTSSPFVGSIEPITASDDEIRAALEDAEVPPLLPALAYMTGDMGLLLEHLRPNALMIGMPQGGLTEEQLAEARELAFVTLKGFRDGGSQPAPVPDEAQLLQIMEYAVAGGGMAPYLPLLEEELAFRGDDRRAPDWSKNDIAPDVEFRVVIIGAGMSGILTAHRLQQAGVPFVVIEKNPDVGGTWFENTYPGCRVDNPNHNYSYSFAQRHDWPLHFSTHEVLFDYLARCAEAFDVRRHIKFEHEVVDATWSDTDRVWTVRVQTPDGEETFTAEAVVSAVGQLNRPSYPDIEGVGSFAGPTFHSAAWDHSVELAGKRVAVIGTGASAVQFIPEIAPVAGELLVFQRTPPWLGPTDDYHKPVAPGLRWLYKHVPSYSEWNRFWIFWRMGDGVLPGVTVDPEWDRTNGSVSFMNDMMKTLLTQYLEEQFADRPDLLEHVVPNYPPGAKRLLRDNGVWAGALKRATTQLITTPIRAITSTGVVTDDGVTHEADVLIYGTGFQASNFLTPMRVYGAGGTELHEHWAGEARAYLGITIPGFPNLFCLYGPNTNIVVNGSIVYFSECGVRYILGCIETLLAGGHRALDVRKDVHDAYNEEVDAENARMAWGASDVNTWYKNASGRITQNWPFTLLEYWERTREPNSDDYEFVD